MLHAYSILKMPKFVLLLLLFFCKGNWLGGLCNLTISFISYLTIIRTVVNPNISQLNEAYTLYSLSSPQWSHYSNKPGFLGVKRNRCRYTKTHIKKKVGGGWALVQFIRVQITNRKKRSNLEWQNAIQALPCQLKWHFLLERSIFTRMEMSSYDCAYEMLQRYLLRLSTCPDEQENLVCHHFSWFKKTTVSHYNFFSTLHKGRVCKCDAIACLGQFWFGFDLCFYIKQIKKLSLARQQNSQTLSINCKRTPRMFTWLMSWTSWNRGRNCLWFYSLNKQTNKKLQIKQIRIVICWLYLYLMWNKKDSSMCDILHNPLYLKFQSFLYYTI